MLLLSLLLAPALFRLSTAEKPFQCPVEDIIRTKCQRPRDCLYPNPGSCNTYIQCTVNPGGRTGTPVIMPCRKGSEWNDNIKLCDKPERSTCSALEGVETVVKGKVDNVVQPAENKIRDAGAFTCPLDDIARTGCTGAKDCLYPDPRDYSSYIQCVVNGADGRTSKPTLKRCAAGLKWNNNTKECDSLRKSIRSAQDKAPAPVYGGVVESAKNIVSDVVDHGVENQVRDAALERCPPGLIWNHNTKECHSLASLGKPTRSAEDKGSSPVDGVVEGAKNLASGVIAHGVESQARDVAPFICPRKEIRRTACKGAKDCVYANPGSCNTYIKCSVNADGRTATSNVHSCSASLEWNDKDKICDFPEHSTCPMLAYVETPLRNEKDRPQTREASIKIRSTIASRRPAQGRAADGFSCLIGDSTIQCLAPKACLFADPESCASFYLCRVNPDGLTGTVSQSHCPSNLLWNDELKACDYPDRTECKLGMGLRGDRVEIR